MPINEYKKWNSAEKEVKVLCYCTQFQPILWELWSRNGPSETSWIEARGLGSDITKSTINEYWLPPGREHNLYQGQFLWRDSAMTNQQSTFLTTGKMRASLLEEGPRWQSPASSTFTLPPSQFPYWSLFRYFSLAHPFWCIRYGGIQAPLRWFCSFVSTCSEGEGFVFSLLSLSPGIWLYSLPTISNHDHTFSSQRLPSNLRYFLYNLFKTWLIKVSSKKL